jgi:hypothetical protein
VEAFPSSPYKVVVIEIDDASNSSSPLDKENENASCLFGGGKNSPWFGK